MSEVMAQGMWYLWLRSSGVRPRALQRPDGLLIDLIMLYQLYRLYSYHLMAR
jgi:hypothetical protein